MRSIQRTPPPSGRSSSRQGGFTLVELMVALVLGLVLLMGVISILTASRQSYAANENLARLQENARVAFETLGREIREAGSTPCGSLRLANVTFAPASLPWWADWDAGTVRGYDGAQNSSPIRAVGTASAERVNGTDAIIALRMAADEAAISSVVSHNAAGTSVQTAATVSGVTTSGANVISICDAASAVLLKVTSISGPTMGYGGAGSNCSTNLGHPTGTCDSTTPAKTFGTDAMVARFDPVFWYVGNNSRAGKSLYRQNLSSTEEMVPGVEDLQIDYLTRNSAGTLATAWVAASDAKFTSGEKWKDTNTDQVIAVRLTLTLRSDTNASAISQPLQRSFTTVVALRGRAR